MQLCAHKPPLQACLCFFEHQSALHGCQAYGMLCMNGLYPYLRSIEEQVTVSAFGPTMLAAIRVIWEAASL